MSIEPIMLYIILIISAIFFIVHDRKEKKILNIDRATNSPCYSHSYFDRQTYDQQKERSETNFYAGLRIAENNNDLLILIRQRLLELFILRQTYETTHATDKEELYRESSVMAYSIERLKQYDDETDLITYCALLLDAFDKDREYHYGLRNEKIYKTRYIYGSVQAIVEDAIKEIENYQTGFLDKVYDTKKKIQARFRKLYAENMLKSKAGA